MLIFASDNYKIPDSVVGIGELGIRTFYDKVKTKYVIPENIEILDYMAIYCSTKNCAVNYMDFSNVKEIGFSVLRGTYVSNEATIILPKTIVKMSEDAFWFHMENKNVNYFYKGTLSDWNNIQIIDYKNAIHYIRDNDVELEFLEGNNLYFYSEIEPVEKGKYWHFDNNNQPIVWN